MSSQSYKGQKAPSQYAFYPADRVIGAPNLHEQKLAAWELAVGERSPASHPPSRIARAHRGTLDDMDLSLAVPFPTKPSRVSRIAGWVRDLFGEAKEERRHSLVRNL